MRLLICFFFFCLTFSVVRSQTDTLVSITYTSGLPVTILYKNCPNFLNVSIPALGESYKPVFRCEGGNLVLSKLDKRLVQITPLGNFVTLHIGHKVRRKYVHLKTIRYNCETPPLPQLSLWIDGKKWDGVTPVSRLSRALVSLESDAEFTQQMPEEAVYEIQGLSVSKRMPFNTMMLVKNRLNSEKSQYPKIEFELFDLWTKEEQVDFLTIKVENIFRFDRHGNRYIESFTLSQLAFNVPVVKEEKKQD